MKFLLATFGSAHLRPIARALQEQNALAGVWICDKNSTGIDADKYRRCWPYHLAMKPFYHVGTAGSTERMAMTFFPIWTWWMRRQKAPAFDVAYAPQGSGRELFNIADKTGALKVVDATNSHPTSYYGFWQRECDLWCPGAKPGWPRWLLRRCNQELERADLIICPSEYVYDSMLYNGIPKSKCVINHYGVNTKTFTPRTSPPEKIQFVCVGLIGLRKGQQYLFRAFEKVKKVLPEAKLVCVGGYYPDFKLERRRWEGTFTRLQNISDDELAKTLRESTAFVFPSQEEGFAKAVIEAMAAGLPVVATYQSGATTLVKDGVEGFIVNSRNIDEVADRMIKLATDRGLNERMGRAAYEAGAKKNSWNDYAERLINICAEAIAKKRKNK